jgi:hypothetical protein
MLNTAPQGRCWRRWRKCTGAQSLRSFPGLFGYLTLVEIGPLRSKRNLMQGDIITDIVCRAESASSKLSFVCCRKVDNKEALQLRGWGAKLVQGVVLPMQDG